MAGAISIHALREEGDHLAGQVFRHNVRISIHALREEGDPRRDLRIHVRGISIHALREEGDIDNKDIDQVRQISIHALREEGDTSPEQAPEISPVISIHALREEGDARPAGGGRCFPDFYPRPPRGGRQQKQRQNLYFQTNYTTFCTNLEEP